jgi:hypothetical protein
MSVSCECCVLSEVSASGWSLVQRNAAECGVCLSVIVKPRKWGGPGPLGAVAPLGGRGLAKSFFGWSRRRRTTAPYSLHFSPNISEKKMTWTHITHAQSEKYVYTFCLETSREKVHMGKQAW